jgi:outer membrane protein assembly factor BamB
VQDGSEAWKLSRGSPIYAGCALSLDGKVVFTSAEDGVVAGLDVHTGKEVEILPPKFSRSIKLRWESHGEVWTAPILSPNGEMLYVASCVHSEAKGLALRFFGFSCRTRACILPDLGLVLRNFPLEGDSH